MWQRHMDRRNALKVGMTYGVGMAIAALNWLQLLDGKQYAKADDIPWGYGQDNGPDRWGTASESYQTCTTGTKQSPIDLETAKAQSPELVHPANAPVFHYRSTPLLMSNTGHTIQVEGDGLSTLELDGERFKLLQLHFHHPSEHRLNGDRFPMEMHLVHGNPLGQLAVASVLLIEGQENSPLQPIWDSISRQKTVPMRMPGKRVNLAALIPGDRTLFRYQGSLTTPPCSEAVQWIVFKTPMELSAAQIAAFKAIFPLNARPIQPMNDRGLTLSG